MLDDGIRLLMPPFGRERLEIGSLTPDTLDWDAN